MRSLRSMQAGDASGRIGTQHRRHARRERARNAPHLRCKKRGSASAASIIARHGCRAGATTGRSAMDGYRDVPFTPTCSAYAVWKT